MAMTSVPHPVRRFLWRYMSWTNSLEPEYYLFGWKARSLGFFLPYLFFYVISL